MTELPPAGWYDDPTSPVDERWWDGEKWSEQTRRKAAQEYQHRPGELRSVSEYLSHAFGLIRIRWDDFLLVAALAAVVGALTATAFVRPVVEVIDVVDNRLVGFGATQVVLAIGFVLIAGIVFAIATMAQYRIAWEAATGKQGTWTAALSYGVSGAPRLIGWGLVALGPLLLAGLLGIALVPLGAFFIVVATIGLLIAMTWWGVVIAFIPAALVAGPAGTNPITTALRITKNRWWKVFGRLILIGLISGAVVQVIGAITSQLTGTSFFGFQLVATADGGFDIVKDLGNGLDFFVVSLASTLLSFAANVAQFTGVVSIAHDVTALPSTELD